MKYCWSSFIDHGKCVSINGPQIKALFSGILFLKCHLNRLVGGRSSCSRLSEPRIAPAEMRRRDPLRFAHASRIFNHDAHAMVAVIVGKISHGPDTWMIHVYDG